MITTRFAPSPTGHPHLGSLMIAFVNYLYSKKHKGKFLLRIEDSDLSRSSNEYEIEIIEALKSFNIIPDNINNYPKQSRRIEIYKKYAQKLVDKGFAYYNPLPLKKDYLLEIYLRYKVFNDYVDYEINGLLYEEILDYVRSKSMKIESKSQIQELVEKFVYEEKNRHDIPYEKIQFISNLLYVSLYAHVLFTKDYVEKITIEELQELLSSFRIATNRDNNYIRQEKYYNIDRLVKSGKIKIDPDKNAIVLMVIPHYYTDNYKWNRYYPEIRKNLYETIIKDEDGNAPKIAYYDIIQNKIFTKDIRSMTDLVIMRYNEQYDTLVPTYNFGCVIDDYEMGITHVIRGMDHKENTFYQILLYYMLDMMDKMPKFGHIPLLLNQKGHKLSKRDLQGLSLQSLLYHYSRSAILNYLFNILHNRDNSKQHMLKDMDDFIKELKEDKICKRSVRIDDTHLKYINKYHIKHLITEDEIYNMIKNEIDVDKELAKDVIKLWKNHYAKMFQDAFLRIIKIEIKNFDNIINGLDNIFVALKHNQECGEIVKYIFTKYIYSQKMINSYDEFKKDIIQGLGINENKYIKGISKFRKMLNLNPGPSIIDIINLIIKYKK
jgi:glutamyl/glutaminyl-tRNA synthetase